MIFGSSASDDLITPANCSSRNAAATIAAARSPCFSISATTGAWATSNNCHRARILALLPLHRRFFDCLVFLPLGFRLFDCLESLFLWQLTRTAALQLVEFFDRERSEERRVGKTCRSL